MHRVACEREAAAAEGRTVMSGPKFCDTIVPPRTASPKHCKEGIETESERLNGRSEADQKEQSVPCIAGDWLWRGLRAASHAKRMDISPDATGRNGLFTLSMSTSYTWSRPHPNQHLNDTVRQSGVGEA